MKHKLTLVRSEAHVFVLDVAKQRFIAEGDFIVRAHYSEAALHTDRYTQNACTASATGGVQAF